MQSKSFSEVYRTDYLANWTAIRNLRKPVIAALSLINFLASPRFTPLLYLTLAGDNTDCGYVVSVVMHWVVEPSLLSCMYCRKSRPSALFPLIIPFLGAILYSPHPQQSLVFPRLRLELSLVVNESILSLALGLSQLSNLGGGTQRLTGIVGKSRAMELILTGRQFGADDAERWGVVSRVVREEKAEGDEHLPVVKEALNVASNIAEFGQLATQAAKEAVNAGV